MPGHGLLQLGREEHQRKRGTFVSTRRASVWQPMAADAFLASPADLHRRPWKCELPLLPRWRARVQRCSSVRPPPPRRWCGITPRPSALQAPRIPSAGRLAAASAAESSIRRSSATGYSPGALPALPPSPGAALAPLRHRRSMSREDSTASILSDKHGLNPVSPPSHGDWHIGRAARMHATPCMGGPRAALPWGRGPRREWGRTGAPCRAV